MLDVIVRLFRNGLQISGKKDNGSDNGDTATLGKAVIGRMKLGKT